MGVSAEHANISVVIENGETKSAAFKILGDVRGMMQMPGTMTGSAISFEVSADGETFVPLYNASNSAISQNISASRGYALPAELFGARYAKLVSGSAEGADRTILVSLKGN